MSAGRPVGASPAEKGSPRDVGIDLVRGIAIIAMFVAHVAASSGPAGVLVLADFLAFPLFALLVGAGAEMGARSHTRAGHLVGCLVRGVVLLALGRVLVEAGTNIAIVLAPLGALTVLCWGISLLPTLAVVAVGITAGLLAPWSMEASRELRIDLMVEQSMTQLWFVDLFVHLYYPMAILIAAACAGIVLLRWLRPRRGEMPAWPLGAGAGLALLAACGAATAARATGALDLDPYDVTHVVVAFVVALAASVFCLGLGLAQWVGPGLQKVLMPVAWAGAMALTLYVLQILWLAWWARGLFPGTPDDSWPNLAGMIAGALVLASAWHALRLPAPWRRGPLEGIVAMMALMLRRLARQ